MVRRYRRRQEVKRLQTWAQTWGALVTMAALLGTIIGVGAFYGRLVSLEGRAEAHLAQAPAEAKASAALEEVVKGACTRIERMERQVDDLHKLLMQPRHAAAPAAVTVPAAAAR